MAKQAEPTARLSFLPAEGSPSETEPETHGPGRHVPLHPSSPRAAQTVIPFASPRAPQDHRSPGPLLGAVSGLSTARTAPA